MTFNRTLGMLFLIVGIVLLVFGLKSTHAAGEQIAHAVQGRFTQTTMWYIIGGIVLIILGGGLALRRR